MACRQRARRLNLNPLGERLCAGSVHFAPRDCLALGPPRPQCGLFAPLAIGGRGAFFFALRRVVPRSGFVSQDVVGVDEQDRVSFTHSVDRVDPHIVELCTRRLFDKMALCIECSCSSRNVPNLFGVQLIEALGGNPNPNVSRRITFGNSHPEAEAPRVLSHGGWKAPGRIQRHLYSPVRLGDVAARPVLKTRRPAATRLSGGEKESRRIEYCQS
jgi:hypothetical protein